MGSSVKVATIGGIEIGIHYSWLLVFFLVAWTLAAGLFPDQYPGLGRNTYWVMGFTASLLLFVSVLIHELAHSFVAKSRGLGVTGITLFIFGGVSNLAEEARSAAEEFQIAIVGPLTSLVLAGLFWVASRAAASPEIDGILSYMVYINVTLAVFNLIPGFPLDGGRVLRAILWAATNSLSRATRIAAGVGRVVAFLFIFGGIFMAFTGSFISGLWLMFIGWFLNNAAESSSQQMELATSLRGVRVGSVMNPRPVVIEPNVRLSDLVSDYVLRRGIRALPVVEGDQLVGMVTLHQVRAIPQESWDETPVRFVMTNLNDLHTTTAVSPLSGALHTMSEHDVNQLPVVENGRLAGLLSRSDVMRFLRVREELGIPSPEEKPAA